MRSPATLLLAALWSALPAAPAAAAEACDALLARIAAGGPAAGERLASREGLAAFYAERECRPAWFRDGAAVAGARELLAALRAADREGLRPADYHAGAIEALLARGGDPTELDLLLSDAFLRYGAHLTAGRVNPSALGREWNVEARGRDLVYLMRAALDGGHVAKTLAGLPPPTPGYRALREALAALRAAAAAGGWPRVPAGPSLRRGDAGTRVDALRARLAAGGELAAAAAAEPAAAFDEPLEAAVVRYQRTHGLDPDGVAGKRTVASLNVSAAARARQAAANLERLRWLPRELGPRRVVVNIADFSLEVHEGGAPALAMRVIAGRDARRTPFFAAEITSIVVNPTWTVPLKIALEDKLPLIVEDRGWLLDQGVLVYRLDGERWLETDPAAVPWESLGPGNFPYRLVQQPGPKNALGRIKFQMPNPHDVYLHDTPSRELFARAERTFSSGCIRVERALDLAALLLRDDPAWPRARIEAAIDAGETVKVRLPSAMPVFLLYATAWVDEAGVLQLREDVYGRDEVLAAALGLTAAGS